MSFAKYCLSLQYSFLVLGRQEYTPLCAQRKASAHSCLCKTYQRSKLVNSDVVGKPLEPRGGWPEPNRARGPKTYFIGGRYTWIASIGTGPSPFGMISNVWTALVSPCATVVAYTLPGSSVTGDV